MQKVSEWKLFSDCDFFIYDKNALQGWKIVVIIPEPQGILDTKTTSIKKGFNGHLVFLNDASHAMLLTMGS